MNEALIKLKLDGLRVLWVEDRPEALVDQRKALQECGVEVGITLTVNKAFRQLVDAPDAVDLVILDSIMPQREELPKELEDLRIKHNVLADSELNGLLLARWLADHGKPLFFVLTVVPEERLGIDSHLFFDKADEQCSPERFAQLLLAACC